MSAPDASLLRRACPAYRAAVQSRRPETPVGAGVAGYRVSGFQRHAGCPAVPVRLLLVTGEAIDVRLPLAVARSLAADLLGALPLSPLAHANELTATTADIRAGNGP
ncbi:hypothetical protein H5P28_00250 [Ruficoccus amylovorans]|uniref:Uncharacterized protein n=1 Tax=Ruficoccus amylovorans TaxID=1804625 RepID=A0A842H8H9_9BACT|nr:hypothetical protein [Ruficoccus amylovorans]MBC2592682.1 hypothetical protein [Ruficoccus amylovorans]